MKTQPDDMVPDPVVCTEFGITSMTLWRWERDPGLDFPVRIKIRTKNYRSRKALEEFKHRMAQKALAERGRRTRA